MIFALSCDDIDFSVDIVGVLTADMLAQASANCVMAAQCAHDGLVWMKLELS